ncbi:MAG: hypothetical protein JRI34_04890 [Deltaproteobacteria bacterium]|nr:hypothetical protein [Deltaproteobacteria bacterium]
MAFAYRLLCMLAPPAITRRLQKYLAEAVAYPGIVFPPGFTYEPGMVFPAGFVFPPGWLPGDPLPPGILPPGINWDDPSGATMPPDYLAPWQPGPIDRSRTSGGVTLETYVFYSNLSDGYVKCEGAGWQACHDAVNGTLVDINVGAAFNAFCSQYYDASFSHIYRSFYDFDLSSLPDRTPVEVFLRIYNDYDSESSVCVQASTHDIPLSLSGYSAFSGSFFDHIPWSAGENIFSFNASGISFIKSRIGAIAKLCLREYIMDYLNVDTSTRYWYHNGGAFRNHADPTRWPALTVTL